MEVVSHESEPLSEGRLAKVKAVIANRQRDLVMVLEDIYDPHNAEAVFRTCEAFGIETAHLIFEKQTPFNPRKVGKSTSSSANKWLSFVTHRSTESALTMLKSEGYRIFATTLSDQSQSLYDISFLDSKVAILMGNEHRGLSEAAHRLADVHVNIPMWGMVQSLNLSVTAAIMIYEVTRQRVPNIALYRLNAAEQAALLPHYTDRSKGSTPITKIEPGTTPVLGRFGRSEHND